jgi:predicted HAD superfamily phosphohydrolase YqeG/predicted amidophosphoribosyltransferase
MTHLIFDLDETLIDTSCLKPYRGTAEGREHIVNKINKVKTSLYSPALRNIVRSFHRRDRVAIVTNSPLKFAKAVLKKHDFPNDLPIVANAKKPDSSKLRKFLRNQYILAHDSILIGDAAVDILAAHTLSIPSIGVTWGTRSTKKQLEKAEATAIIDNGSDLEDVITDIEEGFLEYQEREDPERYLFMPNYQFNSETPDIELSSLGIYHAVNSGCFDTFSGKILTYKSAKECSINEIKDGATSKYYSYGRVNRGDVFIDVIEDYIDRLGEHIDDLNLKGKTCLVPVPNSSPEYCYKSDINHALTRTIANMFDCCESVDKRAVYRVFPKSESHTDGNRSLRLHYQTIGLRPDELMQADNIVLFDDIQTTGNQLKSVGAILKHFGVEANLYAVTLG